jgi:hypothetical protein
VAEGGAAPEMMGAGPPAPAGAAAPATAEGGARTAGEGGGGEAAAIPGDVGPEIRDLLTRLQSSLEADRIAIRDSAAAATQTLFGSGEDAKGQVSGTIAALTENVTRSAGDKVTSVQDERLAAEGRIVASHESTEAAAADSQSAAADQALSTLEDGAQRIEAGADENVESLSTYGETKAGEVESAATANAAEAEGLGRSYGSRYEGESAGEGSEAAEQHGEDVGAAMRDTGQTLADSARDKGGLLAGELDTGAQILLDSIDGLEPLLQEGFESAGVSASDALAQTRDQALPEVDGMAATASSLLASIGMAVAGGLAQLGIRFDGLVDLGVGKGSAALDASAQERIAQIDAVESVVFDELAGVPADPTGELADALQEVEDAAGEEAETSAVELAEGAGEMSGELEFGAEVGDASAQGLAENAELIMTDIEGQTGGALDTSASETEGGFSGLLDQIGQAFTEAVTCTLSYFLPALDYALEVFGLGVDEGERQVDESTDPGVERQRKDITSLAEYLYDELQGYINEGGVLGFLADVLVFIVAVIEAFVGIIVGLIEAIVNFIIGLVLLVVGLVVALFAIGVLAGLLFMSLWECVGLVLALIITLLFIVVALVLLVVVLALAIVAGIIFILYSIVMNIIAAFSGDPTLGPFERGRLIGLAVGDIILLLIPFAKGKIKIRLPAWLAEWLAKLRPISAILIRLLRLCEFDVALLIRLVRLIRNLEKLEAILRGIVEGGGKARQLATVLEAALSESSVFSRLAILAEESPAKFVELVNLAGSDAPLLVEMVRGSASIDNLLGVLRAISAQGIDIARVGSIIKAGAKTSVTLDVVNKAGIVGLEIIEALIGRGLTAAEAVETVRLAQGLGMLAEVGELARSPNFLNPESLPKFLEAMTPGNRVTFNEALARVRAGNRVELESRVFDIIDRTAGEVIESKRITSTSNSKLRSEINDATDNLNRAAGEADLAAMTRTIRLDLTANPRLAAADRATVRAEFAGRTRLTGVNRVEVHNAHPDSPHIFNVDPATGTVGP